MAKGDGNRLPYGEASFNHLYVMRKRHAEHRKKLTFNLSKEECLLLFTSNCYYCGNPPNQVAGRNTRHFGEFIYCGIDRIDNTLGYIKGNVVPCCKVCNSAKSSRTQEDFFSWVKQVHKNHFSGA